MTVVLVGTFTKSILIEIAERQGYFTEASLEVTEIPVSSSPAQFEMLERGEINLAITSPDNVLAYRYISKNPLGRNLDLRILGAVDRGLGLSLCYAPGINSAPATFGVDVPTSGFAFVGYELMERHGVEYGNYEVITLGSTPKRRIELVAKNVDSTILNAGNEIKAISQGAVKIADVSHIGSYLGTVLSTLGEPTHSVRDFQRIINKVVTEILAGEYSDLIIAIAAKNLDLTMELAELHYRMLLDPIHGLVPKGTVDIDSIQTLINLRNKFLPTSELNHVIDDFDSLVKTI